MVYYHSSLRSSLNYVQLGWSLPDVCDGDSKSFLLRETPHFFQIWIWWWQNLSFNLTEKRCAFIFDVCLNVIDLLKYDCTWTGETSDNSITYTVFLRKQKSTQKAQTIVSSNTAIRALVPNSSSICSLSMSNFENKACHFHCFCWWWKDARKLSSDQTF